MKPMSPSTYREMIAKAAEKPRRKFGNTKTTVGSHTFDSKKEARRYSDLFILQQRGEISELTLQPSYDLIVNGHKVCSYKADFRYLDKTGRVRIEDVKGGKATKTPTYRIKRKLFEALYAGLKIEEV